MLNRIIAGVCLATALTAAPALAQNPAGWTCAAGEGAGRAQLEYDARRQLQSQASSVSWGVFSGPLRVAFGLPVTGPDRFAATPTELRVLTDAAAGGPEPTWLELVADGRPLFSGPVSHNQPVVFRSAARKDAPVVAGAWAARTLRVRFLDAARRPVGGATVLLPTPDHRAGPLSDAFARASGRLGDPKVCSPR